MSRARAPVVGIDLGTTNSVVAVFRKGKVEVLANDSGNRTTPSVVGCLDGEFFVGDAATDLPASAQVYDAKRLIGRPWDDEYVQADLKRWPFTVVEHKNAPRIKVKVGEKDEVFAPEEISAMVLRNLKETASAALGEAVCKAVITVPAYFNERQRQDTRMAGRLAGLEVLAIINEPTAAAIAYGLDKKTDQIKKKTIFAYDLGGGTFDVSVMVVQGNKFRVLASGGDTHLGGQDFDARLMDFCVQDIRQKHGVDLKALADTQALQDLRKACELAKRKLSNFPEAPLRVYFPRHRLGYSTKISRALFEEKCADLFKKTTEISKSVLDDANVRPCDVDEVLLVGGSSRIPHLRSMLSELFGGKELCRAINPDEAVAFGAAVHAAALAGDTSVGPLYELEDVTPLSLGVNVVGDRFSVVVPKNTPIPCKRTARYVSVEDDQSFLSHKVYQGERALVKYNHCLNKEYSVEVLPLPAGEAKIDVTFEIDRDGLLTVTAVDPVTKNQKRVQITQKDAQITEKEAQLMIERARKYQTQDEEEVKRIVESLEKMGMQVNVASFEW